MSRLTNHRIRHKLANRDGWLCCYCKREMNCHTCLQQRSPGRLSATIEHVIPVKHGGTWAQDNLKLACSKCNNERGAYIISDDVTAAELAKFKAAQIRYKQRRWACLPGSTVGEKKWLSKSLGLSDARHYDHIMAARRRKSLKYAIPLEEIQVFVCLDCERWHCRLTHAA